MSLNRKLGSIFAALWVFKATLGKILQNF